VSASRAPQPSEAARAWSAAARARMSRHGSSATRGSLTPGLAAAERERARTAIQDSATDSGFLQVGNVSRRDFFRYRRERSGKSLSHRGRKYRGGAAMIRFSRVRRSTARTQTSVHAAGLVSLIALLACSSDDGGSDTNDVSRSADMPAQTTNPAILPRTTACQQRPRRSARRRRMRARPLRFR
jgi:hypothetical protein